MQTRFSRRASLSVFLTAAPVFAAFAQSPRVVTADDYRRAERFMSYYTTPLVFGLTVRPTWLSGDRFWYSNATPRGTEFVLVDPARGTRARAFDQARIAAALSAATGTTYDSLRLPFSQFEFATDGRAIVVAVGGRRWTCDERTQRCGNAVDARETAVAPPTAGRGGRGGGRGGARPEVRSPDGKHAVYIRDYNLW